MTSGRLDESTTCMSRASHMLGHDGTKGMPKNREPIMHSAKPWGVKSESKGDSNARGLWMDGTTREY